MLRKILQFSPDNLTILFIQARNLSYEFIFELEIIFDFIYVQRPGSSNLRSLECAVIKLVKIIDVCEICTDAELQTGWYSIKSAL